MSVLDKYRVSVPEGEVDGAVISRFTVGESDLANVLAAVKHGRGTRPGTYTALHVDRVLWMSDTDAEVRDHLSAIREVWPGDKVLVHGLGLGMVVQAAILQGAASVDVVELDPRVIALVGEHYEKLGAEHGCTVTIYEGDAFTHPWPKGSSWSVVWHDVWPTLCADNLPEMHRLHRRFGRRTRWQGSWGRRLVEQEERRWAARGW